ncbi:MAG: helix-turn-helix transcriptional regulator [Desulfovermiculus sp.]
MLAHQQVIPITSGMRSVVNEILDPDFAKGPVYLFYLAKILELIYNILAIDDVIPFNDTSPSNMQIIQKSIACMEEAMDNPPSIVELASRAGVSASKLKQLFPHICGTTPYAYLRRLRMEKAISLLRQGEMNVTEVAYAVGYDSISHFSKLFHQYHGIHPSRVRRQTCTMIPSNPKK